MPMTHPGESCAELDNSTFPLKLNPKSLTPMAPLNFCSLSAPDSFWKCHLPSPVSDIHQVNVDCIKIFNKLGLDEYFNLPAWGMDVNVEVSSSAHDSPG